MIDGAKRDSQSVTADWTVLQDLIAGVVLREVRHVTKDSGYVTELWRRDWQLDDRPVDQVFQVTLHPGGCSAWHAHMATTDRLFVAGGLVKIVLYDPREDSATQGLVNEFRLGEQRPGLVIVPPGVWHGIRNIGPGTARVANLVDAAYDYEDPDHWRVPADSPEIPYRI
jgi:dTDP-4-dehydrorhamnose 3,5-epimerase